MPTSQQETCWITSLRLTGTSLRSTSRSTLNTCTGLGILNRVSLQADSRLCRLFWSRGLPHRSTATNQSWVYKNICNGPLHERMSPVEREAHHWKNLDTIQIAFCSRSPSTQADAGIVRCHSRLPLCKCRRYSEWRSDGRSHHWSISKSCSSNRSGPRCGGSSHTVSTNAGVFMGKTRYWIWHEPDSVFVTNIVRHRTVYSSLTGTTQGTSINDSGGTLKIQKRIIINIHHRMKPM
jgi:hypothetical protein